MSELLAALLLKGEWAPTMIRKSRIYSIPAFAVLLNCLLVTAASAGFFGFGSDEKGKSGLDFNRGYDVNTVATVSGRVVSAPHQGEHEQYLIEVRSGSEVVNISVGPGSFWEKKGFAIKVNDEVSAKGSKAQGQDGKVYLLSQKLVNHSTGAKIELRGERGEPVWSGRDAAGMGMERSVGGSMERGGMMRGGMMRGMGGGMMRH